MEGPRAWCSPWCGCIPHRPLVLEIEIIIIIKIKIKIKMVLYDYLGVTWCGMRSADANNALLCFFASFLS